VTQQLKDAFRAFTCKLRLLWYRLLHWRSQAEYERKCDLSVAIYRIIHAGERNVTPWSMDHLELIEKYATPEQRAQVLASLVSRAADLHGERDLEGRP
jgi:hypothetical protein